MDFSAEDVEHYEFLLSVPGYNRAEVRAFLQAVAEQLRQPTNARDDGTHATQMAGRLEDESRSDAERAIGELIRAAEIHIEDVANRVVGEFETVRAEISQLLRLLDQRSNELRPSEHNGEPRPASQEVIPEPEPVLESEQVVAEPEPEVPDTVVADDSREMPVEWDDLFAEPKMDS